MSKPPTKPEPQSDDCDVICPYCKATYQAEAEDFSDHDREQTCFECKQVYILYSELSVTHYTRPLPTKT